MISKKPPSSANAAVVTTDVPFSDSLLLTVSIAGFCVLAVTIYRIILARTGKDHHHSIDGDETELSLEEQLLRADVSTLNRAQRRARAKAIMKEQRRATVAAPRADDDNNDHNNNNNNEPDTAAAPATLLSRRERQAAAKAKERQERMQCQSERQRQQDETEQKAQRLKKERLQAERWLAQQQRLAHEQQQEEMRNQWHFMFWENSTTPSNRQQTVEDFVATVTTKKNRTVELDAVASDFGVSVQTVTERLRQLVNEGRLAGYFPNNSSNTFVAVSASELQQMAYAIKARGNLTWFELGTICETVLNNDTDGRSPEDEMG